MTSRLLRQAGGPRASEPPRHPSEFDRLLKTALAERPCTFLVDEAQWLNGEAFEYFRYLWDEPSTQLAVIFVGGEGCSFARQPRRARQLPRLGEADRPHPHRTCPHRPPLRRPGGAALDLQPSGRLTVKASR
ncbi:ATP-binding protein [Streptomyces canus]|uniref:ATP-binding protein n=1 Tax=Streptomyces canus TaxID=58343 RepID=UPI0036ED2C74